MSEINVEVKGILNPKVTSKIVEEKEEGEVVDRTLVTAFSFEAQVNPGKFDDVLWALKCGHEIDVTFTSPQGILDSITFKSGDKEVTLR